jgi:SPP1 family predicted phage head-tail adaptor
MYFSDKITLRKETVTLDEYGDSAYTYTDTTVFADVKSVTRSEFYSASMAGIKIDIVFAVHAEDYNNQTIVTYGTTQYNIVRTYKKGEGIVELNCAVREVV